MSLPDTRPNVAVHNKELLTNACDVSFMLCVEDKSAEINISISRFANVGLAGTKSKTLDPTKAFILRLQLIRIVSWIIVAC